MTFLNSSVDITWIMGDVFIWSSVEPCIGILCACLPTIRPLLRAVLRYLLGPLRAERTFGPSSDRAVNELHPPQYFQRPVSIGPCCQLEMELRSEDRETRMRKAVTHVEVIGSFHDGASDEDWEQDPLSIRVKKEFQWSVEQK